MVLAGGIWRRGVGGGWCADGGEVGSFSLCLKMSVLIYLSDQRNVSRIHN